MDPQSDSSHGGNSSRNEEIMVGFEDEAMELLERLTGMQKRLEVIPIVGMAGLGKTTLAKKVYDDPFIAYHFHIRAWTTISQVYHKRDVLLSILSTILDPSSINDMNNEKLCDLLRKRLLGNRFLIVMDDIWDIGAWEDLKRCFPDNNVGSRIMFTSRITKMTLQAKSGNRPHNLRFLTEDESFGLLVQKVFRSKTCPPEFVKSGKKVARKCQGLPLAIVVIAGVLGDEKTPQGWNEVSKSVSSYIVTDEKQYMETLTLSYNHLPHHLKPCFLYLGAFLENIEIPVWKLIWLWIAEGFIHKTLGKRLEDVAEEYLTDLINRSLVVVAKKDFVDGIKACRLHDMLRDLCIRKAKEENFMPLMHRYKEMRYSYGISQLFIHPSACVHAASMISAPPVRHPFNLSFCEALKLVRVLDIVSLMPLFSFPTKVVELKELRYLALPAIEKPLPVSLSNLRNLEILILFSGVNLTLNLWKMKNLRHLYIKTKRTRSAPDCFLGLQQIENGCCSKLDNLQTLSFVNPSLSCQEVLEMSPNLRKLGICGLLKSNSGELTFPNLGFSNRLKTLKLFNTGLYFQPINSCNPIKFPERLQKLSLKNTTLKWVEMWTIGMLENLEVLKLKDNACVGQKWETCDGGFRRLKLLELSNIDLVQWSASSDDFPRLERLVLATCLKLKKIPSSLGDILSLKSIEVSYCSYDTAKSALEIHEEQADKGNDWLNIVTKGSML